MSTLQRTNQIYNPSFEVNVVDNTELEDNLTSETATLERDTASAFVFDSSAKIVIPASTETEQWRVKLKINTENLLQITEGETYTYGIFIKTSDSRQVQVALENFAAGGTTHYPGSVTTSQGWQRFDFTFKATESGTASLNILMNDGNSGTVWVDGVTFENWWQARPYFDGDSLDDPYTDYQWSGTPHNSPSEQYNTDPDPATTLEEQHEDAWEGYKSRFVDADGLPLGSGHGQESVSEAVGYFLRLAAAFQDQTAFDLAEGFAYNNFRRANRSGSGSNVNLLPGEANEMMGWAYNNGEITDWNWALDADVDRMVGLLHAHALWGSAGSINYLQRALDLASDFRLYVFREDSEGRQIAGNDGFQTEDFRPTDIVVNPSYLDAAAFRLIKQYDTGNETFWESAIDGTYKIWEDSSNFKMVGNFVDPNPGKLPPNWVGYDLTNSKVTNSTEGYACSSCGTVEGSFSDDRNEYSREAFRVPPRWYWDWKWNGETRARDLLQNAAPTFKTLWDDLGLIPFYIDHEGDSFSDNVFMFLGMAYSAYFSMIESSVSAESTAGQDLWDTFLADSFCADADGDFYTETVGTCTPGYFFGTWALFGQISASGYYQNFGSDEGFGGRIVRDMEYELNFGATSITKDMEYVVATPGGGTVLQKSMRYRTNPSRLIRRGMLYTLDVLFPNILFKDGFESGDTSEWNGLSSFGSSVTATVQTDSALVGTYGIDFDYNSPSSESGNFKFLRFHQDPPPSVKKIQMSFKMRVTRATVGTDDGLNSKKLLNIWSTDDTGGGVSNHLQFLMRFSSTANKLQIRGVYLDKDTGNRTFFGDWVSLTVNTIHDIRVLLDISGEPPNKAEWFLDNEQKGLIDTATIGERFSPNHWRVELGIFGSTSEGDYAFDIDDVTIQDAEGSARIGISKNMDYRIGITTGLTKEMKYEVDTEGVVAPDPEGTIWTEESGVPETTWTEASPVVDLVYLLQEDGFLILKEDSGRIMLE